MRFFLLFFFCSTIAFGQTIKPVIQTGHLSKVHAVAIAPDEQHFASGSRDRSIIIWKVADGSILRKLLHHSKTVTSIAFSPSDPLLVSGGNDGKIAVWNPYTGALKHQFAGYEKPITSIALHPTLPIVAIGGYQNEVWVYNFTTQKIITKIKASPDRGMGSGVKVTFSPDGNALAIGEDNRKARVLSTENWEVLGENEHKEGYCGGCGTFMTYSPNGKKIVKTEHNGDLVILKDNLETEQILPFNNRDITSVSFQDQHRFVVTTEDSIQVYSGKNWEKSTIAKPFKKMKWAQSTIAKKGNFLLAGMDNGQIGKYNFETAKWDYFYKGVEPRIEDGIAYDPNSYWQSNIVRYMSYKTPILIHPDNKSIIKGRFGRHIKIWDMATGAATGILSGKDKAVIAMKLSPDQKSLVAATADGWILVNNLKNNKRLLEFQAHRQPIFDLAISHDNTKIATASWDGTTRVYDASNGELVQELYLENNSGYSIQFTQNDLYLMLGRLGKNFEQWDIDTGKKVREFIGPTDVTSQIEWMGNNQFLSASWDGSLRLWNYNNGLQLQKWNLHEGELHKFVVINSTLVASVGEDRKVQLLHLDTGHTQLLGYHDAPVNDLSYSKKENLLLSYSREGVVKCWDLNTGKMFFEHILVGTSDWMALSKEGYFSGTSFARNAIRFVQDSTVYAPDQFFESHYRPELLQSLFVNRGATGKTKSIQQSIQEEPIPAVKLTVIEQEKKADVFIRGLNPGGSINRLVIYHNEKQIEVKKAESKTNKLDWNIVLDLVPGENIIKAIAVNGKGIESGAESFQTYMELPVDIKPTCYLLSIGINTYKNPQLNLNYAVDDAVGFVQNMRNAGGELFEKVIVRELYNEDANKAQIIKALNELSEKVRPEDVLLLYYAGHGSAVEGNFYFIPHEATKLYDKKSLEKLALKADDFQKELQEIKALKQLIIMDACQSGQSVEVLAQRGANQERAIAQLSRSTGIHVMASAGSEQFSTEFAELGHGIFTYVLLKGLAGEADGAPKDGKVTVYELKSYLDDQVPQWAEKYKGVPQYPHTFSVGQDFPVLIMKK